MALVQIGCSTTNPADGTAVGTPTGIATVTTGSGTTRIWRSAVASQANTGIAFTVGTAANSFRTATFAGTITAPPAFTGIFTSPSSNPTAALTVLNMVYTSGSRISWQINSTGGFQQYNSISGTIQVLATLTPSTRYLIQAYYIAGTGSTNGQSHIRILSLAGSTVATLDATTDNIMSGSGYKSLDFDMGGVASNYGWSEIQYDTANNSSFIPAYNATNYPLTAAGSPANTGTATLAISTPLNATGAGTSAGTTALSPSTTYSAAGTGIPASTISLTPTTTYTASSNNLSSGTTAVTVNPSINATSTANTTGTATLTATAMLAAAGNNSSTGNAALGISIAYTATGTGAPTGLVIIGYNESLTAAGNGNTTGTASITPTLTYPLSGNPDTAGSATLTLSVAYQANSDGYSASTHKFKLSQPGRDITVTATLTPRTWAGKLEQRTLEGATNTRRWGARLE